MKDTCTMVMAIILGIVVAFLTGDGTTLLVICCLALPVILEDGIYKIRKIWRGYHEERNYKRQ